MKKLLLTIMMILFLVAPCFAVGTISVSNDSIYDGPNGGKAMRMITIIFTADAAAGTIPDLTLNSSTSGLIPLEPLLGWYAHKIEIDCNHAGTEPTEDSEIYIYQNGFDLLAGGGVDQIDNTAERQVFFSNGTSPQLQPIVNTLTVTITQQAVATNSATGTIYLILTAE